MQITAAKLVGAFWCYSHNGVTIDHHAGNMGAHDLPFGNSQKPYIDVNLQGGQGTYLVIAVIDDVIREIATCGPNVTNLRLTTWASQNGWRVTLKRLTYIF
jgi:hypothetical protein